MNSTSTYYVVVIFMAVAVIVTCGAGITWNYFSAARWSRSRSETAGPATKAEPEQPEKPEKPEQSEHRLAA